jgi:hypothetical protein
MSRIIDPSTGLPSGFGGDSSILQGQLLQLINAFQQLSQKVTAISQQQIHLGLFVEYLQQQLEVVDVVVDPEDFEAWATKRWEEIQEEAKEYMDQANAQAPSPSSSAEELGVRIDD